MPMRTKKHPRKPPKQGLVAGLLKAAAIVVLPLVAVGMVGGRSQGVLAPPSGPAAPMGLGIDDDASSPSTVLAALEMASSQRASVDILHRASMGVGIGLGPDMFISPIADGILGPSVQDLIQKLGNFLTGTTEARIAGILAGAGDVDRPRVLLWTVKDMLARAQEMAERIQEEAMAMKAAAEEQIEEAKELAEIAKAEAEALIAEGRAAAEAAKEQAEMFKAQAEEAAAQAAEAARAAAEEAKAQAEAAKEAAEEQAAVMKEAAAQQAEMIKEQAAQAAEEAKAQAEAVKAAAQEAAEEAKAQAEAAKAAAQEAAEAAQAQAADIAGAATEAASEAVAGAQDIAASAAETVNSAMANAAEAAASVASTAAEVGASAVSDLASAASTVAEVATEAVAETVATTATAAVADAATAVITEGEEASAVADPQSQLPPASAPAASSFLSVYDRIDSGTAALLVAKGKAAVAATLAKLKSSVEAGKAAARAKQAAMETVLATYAAQLATQNQALPSLEKENFALAAASATKTANVAKGTAGSAHRAAASHANLAVALARAASEQATLISQFADGHSRHHNKQQRQQQQHGQGQHRFAEKAHASNPATQPAAGQAPLPVQLDTAFAVETMSFLEVTDVMRGHVQEAKRMAAEAEALAHSARLELASALGDPSLLPSTPAGASKESLLLEARQTIVAREAHRMPAGRAGVFHGAALLNAAHGSLAESLPDLRFRTPRRFRFRADTEEEDAEALEEERLEAEAEREEEAEEQASTLLELGSGSQDSGDKHRKAASSSSSVSSSKRAQLLSEERLTTSHDHHIASFLAALHTHVAPQKRQVKRTAAKEAAAPVPPPAAPPAGRGDIFSSLFVDGVAVTSGHGGAPARKEQQASHDVAEGGGIFTRFRALTSAHAATEASASHHDGSGQQEVRGAAAAAAASEDETFWEGVAGDLGLVSKDDSAPDHDDVRFAAGHEGSAAETGAAKKRKKKFKHPRRSPYVESTRRFKKLGKTEKTIFNNLVHKLTSALSKGVATKLDALLMDSIPPRLEPKAEEYLSTELPRQLIGSLYPSLRAVLEQTVSETVLRSLPTILFHDLNKRLTVSLTKALTHTVSQTIAATAIRASSGWGSPACAHCMATAGGPLAPNVAPPLQPRANGGALGLLNPPFPHVSGFGGILPPILGSEEPSLSPSCNDVCWGSNAGHAAAQGIADGTHANAAFFSDYYLKQQGALPADEAGKGKKKGSKKKGGK